MALLGMQFDELQGISILKSTVPAGGSKNFTVSNNARFAIFTMSNMATKSMGVGFCSAVGQIDIETAFKQSGVAFSNPSSNVLTITEQYTSAPRDICVGFIVFGGTITG